MNILPVLPSVVRGAAFATLRRSILGPRHAGWSLPGEIAAEILRLEGVETTRLKSIDAQRRSNGLKVPSPIIRFARIRADRIAGLDVERIELLRRQNDMIVLYFHGGGYVCCSPQTHRLLTAGVAAASRGSLIAVNYRKVPQARFPEPIQDGEAVIRALYDSGIAPSRLVLAGDSAGGGLAITVMRRLQQAGLPLPAGAVLISPWVDLADRVGSVRRNAGYDYLTPEVLEYYARRYLGAAPADHPEASPAYADLAGLPPLFIVAGGAEALHDQIVEFAARAKNQGVDARLEVWPGMIHVFPMFSAVFPEGREALRQIGRFVRGLNA